MRRSVLLGIVMSLVAAFSVYAECFVDCFCPEVVRWNEDGVYLHDRCYYLDIYNEWGRCGNLRYTALSHTDPDPDPNAWQLVWVAVEPGDHCASSCTGDERKGQSAGVAANVSGWSDPPTYGYLQQPCNRECRVQE